MSIETIRAVRDAAQGLTIACTAVVGPVPMALRRPLAPQLAAPLPPEMLRRVRAIEAKERKR